MRVCVIGLGKIGLPLAVQFALKGSYVLGLDTNADVVRKVNAGVEPFPGEKDLDQYLNQCIRDGKFAATTDPATALANSDVVIVAIPLVIDENQNPDFRGFDEVTQLIGRFIKKNQLISYETTLPVGTLRNRILPLIEKVSGLKAGEDFYLIHSPERVLTGQIFSDLRRYPKIVGGITTNCTTVGANFYKSVLDFDVRTDLKRENGVWVMDSSESAEFVKIAETTYRDVNIALANQFAKFAFTKNLDIFKIIEAANSQVHSHIHSPGISVGGHCIPVYPHFYLFSDPNSSLVQQARETNESMPAYFVEELEKSMGSVHQQSVLVLGVSYRPGVKESAFSGAIVLDTILRRKGAKTFFVDPFYSNQEIKGLGLTPYESSFGSRISGIIIHTGHPEFKDFDFDQFSNLRCLIDGRNFASGIVGNLDTKFVVFPPITSDSRKH
jgi:nucleotide sugar dehydrogenase